MYNQPNIKETINSILQKENFSNKELVDAIINFINTLKNPDIAREGFKTEEFDDIGVKLGLWTKDPDYFFGSQYNNDNKPVKELIPVLEKALKTDLLNDEEKRNFITEFANFFAECSEDEGFCSNKIYVLIKNISENSGVDIEKEYDSWEEAEKDIDDIYTGCCDDAYFAEKVWFTLLCYIQDCECDECKNFCSILEYDCAGLESGRKEWEEENCEQLEDEEYLNEYDE